MKTRALIEVIEEEDEVEIPTVKSKVFVEEVEGRDEESDEKQSEPPQDHIDDVESDGEPEEEPQAQAQAPPTQAELDAKPQMTLKALKKICREMDMYSTPELNDRMYLHYRGFLRITEDIGHYFGLKVLYLEGNGLTKIENLEKLVDLRCLYVQENCIFELSGLDTLENLDTLNVCNNQIDRLSNLGGLKRLGSLLAARNRFKTAEDVAGVLECPTTSVLDLKDNRIEDPKIIEDVLMKLPNLKVLYLKGNPVVNKIRNYRKTLIAKLGALTYLDDRPVFDNERRTAEAWLRGGTDAEKAEREAIRVEKREKDERNFLAFRKLVEEGKKKMEAARALEAAGAEEAAVADAEEEEEEEEQPKPVEGSGDDPTFFVTQEDEKPQQQEEEQEEPAKEQEQQPVHVEGVVIDMLTDLD